MGAVGTVNAPESVMNLSPFAILYCRVSFGFEVAKLRSAELNVAKLKVPTIGVGVEKCQVLGTNAQNLA